MPLPQTGGISLVFNDAAVGAPLAGGPVGAWEVHDGDYIVDVYPVTKATNSTMAFRKDDDRKRAYVERDWVSADHVGNLGVLSYLLVFRMPGESAATVKNIGFTPGDKTLTFTADVNGSPLSLKTPN
jgi:hypothetical protein